MQQISTEGVQCETWLGRQGNPLGNVQEISIRSYKQMVYAQPGACPKKMTRINSYGTLTYRRINLIPARRPDLIIINKRKRICKIVDFTVPADQRNKSEGKWKEV